ncbi:enkurin domain-containing protein 1 [Lates japonicus]|uniref:Enkurin domain-containing protein 1 n=1 Tax=Lates japonicus TaxID=270547 RepID=A0AAD3R3Y2_LATJO|nr:enkurin domain-containing protein 1 [Lates japonicus]
MLISPALAVFYTLKQACQGDVNSSPREQNPQRTNNNTILKLQKCEGPSSISGPIPPDPSLFPQYYRRPSSARARLEGNHNGTLALHSGPLAPDPSLYPGCDSARTPAHRPRIGPNAICISLETRTERGSGELLKLEGVSITPVPKQKPRVHDFSKENVRRLREIQRRCKEQEAERVNSRPVPLKALWTSSKYDNVPSRVMAQLQIPNDDTNINFLTRVTGIGFFEEGVKTLEDLKKIEHNLNHHQQIGLKYFEEFEKRIPRTEMEKMEPKLLHTVAPPFESIGFVTDTRPKGDTKFMGVCQLQSDEDDSEYSQTY